MELFQSLPINLNARFRTKRMNELLAVYDGQIDREIMYRIASDHGDGASGTLDKSIFQHPGLGYGVKTLVSYIAQPKEKRFWIYEGNPCKNEVKEYSF